MGQNPGRPAYPRPAGLAPPHTRPRLRSRGDIMQPNVSEPRIRRRFDRMDRKSCTRIKGPTIQRKAISKSAIHLPGRSQASTCNIDATEGRGEPEGGQQASPRPAGLARVAIEATQLPPTPGGNQGRPRKGGGQMATLLGWPA